MTEETTLILHEISTLKDSMIQQFKKVDERLGGVETRLDGVENRLDGVENRLDGVENRLDGVENRLDGVETRLDGVETRLDGVEKRLDNVEALARGNRMILENDIPKQINFIAEGHMDLIRKLQIAEEANRKYDKVMINMVSMQNDIRKIKDRLEMA